MTTKLETKLYCLHCNKECKHTITYVAAQLNCIKCEECGTEIELDRKKVLEHCATEAMERLLTKPHRLTEEMRKDLTAFIVSLPIRIVTKPYRVAKEILGTLKDELKREKEKKEKEKEKEKD